MGQTHFIYIDEEDLTPKMNTTSHKNEDDLTQKMKMNTILPKKGRRTHPKD
jgi:hypothetical protein